MTQVLFPRELSALCCGKKVGEWSGPAVTEHEGGAVVQRIVPSGLSRLCI